MREFASLFIYLFNWFIGVTEVWTRVLACKAGTLLLETYLQSWLSYWQKVSTDTTRNNHFSWYPTQPLKHAQYRFHLCPSLVYFIPSPNVGPLGRGQLTAGWRAPCSSHHLSLLTPCCPAYQSAQPPPKRKQISYIQTELWERMRNYQSPCWVRMVGNHFSHSFY
jgi:hypothetical protein